MSAMLTYFWFFVTGTRCYAKRSCAPPPYPPPLAGEGREGDLVAQYRSHRAITISGLEPRSKSGGNHQARQLALHMHTDLYKHGEAKWQCRSTKCPGWSGSMGNSSRARTQKFTS